MTETLQSTPSFLPFALNNLSSHSSMVWTGINTHMGHNPSEPRHLCRCANLTDMEMNADTAVERETEKAEWVCFLFLKRSFLWWSKWQTVTKFTCNLLLQLLNTITALQCYSTKTLNEGMRVLWLWEGGGRKLIAPWLSRKAAVRQCVQSMSPVQNTTRHLCTEHPSTSIRFLV